MKPPRPKRTSTADLCDLHAAAVLALPWVLFGGRRHVDGLVETALVGASNQVIREVLAEPGENRILAVDGGGMAVGKALIGDRLTQIALDNGWQGIVVNGLVRDVDRLRSMPLGLWALGACPVRGPTEGVGERGVPISVGGQVVRPGMRLVGDADGLVVLPVEHRGAATPGNGGRG
jgi:regulator of ribonuclease activity A